MRYKWIELYGYAGFYNGMGLSQIKIDFTMCKTNKIIIRGGNGSGKSTLINAISPIRDSNDCFIANTEARKNICIINNGIEYIIRYIHPVTNSGRGTTKGYISKLINNEFVELNPNGNISSCENIIYEEFKLDSSFMSLSKLSSENRGLVDNKPVERKRLINSIINILDTYNGIYKNLSKKSSALKQMINSLTYKIDYIGSEVQLNAKLQNIENKLIELNEENDKTIEAIAAVNIKISDYINILRDNNYDAVVTELKDITSHNNILRNQILKQCNELNIDDMNSLDSFFNYLDKQIGIYESNIDSLKQQSLLLLTQRDSEYKELQNKRSKLDSLQSEYNYLDIKKAMNESKAIVSKYNDLFNQIGLMNINMITKSEYDLAMESIKHLKELAQTLTSNYSVDVIDYVINNMNIVSACISDIPNLNNTLNDLKYKSSNVNTEIAIYESKKELINELSNRPKDCSIDDCPYIKSALDASKQYPESKYNQLQSLSISLAEDIKDTEDKINLYNKYKEIFNYVAIINSELNSKMKFISKLPVRSDFKESFLNRIISFDSFSDIDNLYKYVDCGNIIEEYKVAQEQLKKYESEYRIYEAKNDIIDSIIKDVESLIAKTDKLAKDIEVINNNILEKQNKLDDFKSAKTKVGELLSKLRNDLKPSEARESELTKLKQALDINSIEINKLQSELAKLNTNLGSVKMDIDKLTKDRDSIKYSLILLSDYKLELQKYSDKYNKIEKIKYYSSPSTGIQTLFMQLYMNKILSTANNLLSLLFDGEFVLQPFIINENEFRIPCLGSGLLHDDISSMSTAQKCMISMILSFSILYQSSTDYNVIMLDEIDSGLDTMNRGYFIELLDKLMSMLHCEQCFMISHNNELNTSACDLIVLKNSSNEIYQGNIIWQY